MGLQNSVPCWVVGRMTDKLPFGGEVVRLGDVCEVVGGATPKTGNTNYWNGSIRWITPAELNNESHVVTDTAKHLTMDGFHSTSLRMMPAGTVLLTTRAPIGKVAIAGAEMCCNQGFKNLICSNKVYNEYLYRYLKFHAAELQSLGSGATFKELSKRTVSNLQIYLPALDFQHEAIQKLSEVDRAIGYTNDLTSMLSGLVKSRFVEMFDGAPWQVVRASDVMTSFRNGVSPSKDADIHERVLTLSAITQGHFDETAWKDGTFKELPASDKRVSDSDFYICRGNGNKQLVGVGEFADDNHPELVFPDTMIAGTINKNLVRKPFLTQVWKHPSVRRQIEAKARTTNGTLKINQKIVSEIRFPLPPLDAQDEFVSFIERVDKLRVVVEKEKQTLQTLYDSLAQEYFAI